MVRQVTLAVLSELFEDNVRVSQDENNTNFLITYALDRFEHVIGEDVMNLRLGHVPVAGQVVNVGHVEVEGRSRCRVDGNAGERSGEVVGRAARSQMGRQSRFHGRRRETREVRLGKCTEER